LRREGQRTLPSSATATYHDDWGFADDGRQNVCRIVLMNDSDSPACNDGAAPVGGPGPAVHPVSPLRAAMLLSELWSPRVIAELDDHCVKVARLEGDFAWHAHADEDELFYVLDGCLHIALPDRQVVLHAGELYVVPRGSATGRRRQAPVWSCSSNSARRRMPAMPTRHAAVHWLISCARSKACTRYRRIPS